MSAADNLRWIARAIPASVETCQQIEDAANRITQLEAEVDKALCAINAYCAAYDDATGTIHVYDLMRRVQTSLRAALHPQGFYHD